VSDPTLPRGLAIDVREGENIALDTQSHGRIVISVEVKSGRRARLRVQSERPLPISGPNRGKVPHVG
jgi:hypothetical protein